MSTYSYEYFVANPDNTGCRPAHAVSHQSVRVEPSRDLLTELTIHRAAAEAKFDLKGWIEEKGYLMTDCGAITEDGDMDACFFLVVHTWQKRMWDMGVRDPVRNARELDVQAMRGSVGSERNKKVTFKQAQMLAEILELTIYCWELNYEATAMTLERINVQPGLAVVEMILIGGHYQLLRRGG